MKCCSSWFLKILYRWSLAVELFIIFLIVTTYRYRLDDIYPTYLVVSIAEFIFYVMIYFELTWLTERDISNCTKLIIRGLFGISIAVSFAYKGCAIRLIKYKTDIEIIQDWFGNVFTDFALVIPILFVLWMAVDGLLNTILEEHPPIYDDVPRVIDDLQPPSKFAIGDRDPSKLP